ncbi:MAG TPA: hypothetical protein VG867_11865 [Rhizomicrobium sp.]|nr:hypothetical protein [Rhizomicrobium sp.]
MNVYVLALACVLGGSCQQGYFLLKNPAFVNCDADILPMIEGHRSKNGSGATVTWHAQGCVKSSTPPHDRQMLGMF